MKQFLVILLGLINASAFGQVEFSTTKHDFGDLEPYSAHYFDLKLKNVGSKQEWLLTVNKTSEVAYIVSKQIMEKDSSIIVRLNVSPNKKGKFNYKVEVFTSDRAEPVVVTLTGNLVELPQDGSAMFTQCPTFTDRPGGRDPNSFDLTVVTVDKETREPLSKSKVTLIQNGEPIWLKTTDKKGKIEEDATLGLSYFYATNTGYYPAELGAYINFQRNYIIVELEKDKRIPEPEIVVVEVDTTDIAEVTPEPEEIEIIIDETSTVEERLDEELATSTSVDTTSLVVEAPPEFSELDPEDFNDDDFKPINVVFVLDVSSSMRSADKMELMKYSLYQLTDMLRKQDKIGIVTYSTETRALLRSISGAQKDKIKEEVKKLRPGGFTAGGAGIKAGFKMAARSMIPDGVNHVIIITDGGFNRQSEDYKKYVRQYARKNIHLSVVGIKNKPEDEEEMRDAAKLGGGHYIPIFGLADAQNNLKQQIRALTFRR